MALVSESVTALMTIFSKPAGSRLSCASTTGLTNYGFSRDWRGVYGVTAKVMLMLIAPPELIARAPVQLTVPAAPPAS